MRRRKGGLAAAAVATVPRLHAAGFAINLVLYEKVNYGGEGLHPDLVLREVALHPGGEHGFTGKNRARVDQARQREPDPTQFLLAGCPAPVGRIHETLYREHGARALSQRGLATLLAVRPFAETANAPDFKAATWHMLFAPRATSRAIVDNLHAEMNKNN